MGVRVINRSGYDTADLRRFAIRGLRACGVRGDVTIWFFSSPIRTRGCSPVGKDGDLPIVVALAPPSYHGQDEELLVLKAAAILKHEAAHYRGLPHARMKGPKLLESRPCLGIGCRGRMPSWARGLRLRYRGRAPNQMIALRAYARSLQPRKGTRR